MFLCLNRYYFNVLSIFIKKKKPYALVVMLSEFTHCHINFLFLMSPWAKYKSIRFFRTGLACFSIKWAVITERRTITNNKTEWKYFQFGLFFPNRFPLKQCQFDPISICLSIFRFTPAWYRTGFDLFDLIPSDLGTATSTTNPFVFLYMWFTSSLFTFHGGYATQNPLFSCHLRYIFV